MIIDSFTLIFGTTVLTGLIILGSIFLVWKHKQDEKKKIAAEIITRKGTTEIIKGVKLDDKGMFEWNGGFYSTTREARLLNEKRRITFHYIEGISEPVNYSDAKSVKGVAEIKIDAENLKKIIRSKLFDDLLNSGTEKVQTIIIIVMLAINMLISGGILLKLFQAFPK